METFNLDKELDRLIQREGDFNFDPVDSGGATRWGITERVARESSYEGPMHELPIEKANEIYREVYWLMPGWDKVAGMSEKIAGELFDTGVNCGTPFAGRALQRALNGLNRNGEDYHDLRVDGLVGPVTLRALSKFINLRGHEGETVLLRCLNGLQVVRYLAICERDRRQERFFFGWCLNRVS